MGQIRVSVKKVDEEAWDVFLDIRDAERVQTGKLLSDLIWAYADEYFDAEEPGRQPIEAPVT